MARPMVLIKKSLLTAIYGRWVQGVPVLALIRQNNLEEKVTAPTLTKLLQYMKILHTSDNEEVKRVIQDSIFPKWLTAEVKRTGEAIHKQPKEMAYKGRMPLGSWSIRPTE